jgi:hypothetical protein
MNLNTNLLIAQEDNFDWECYLSVYEDLRNAGINTEEAALDHWIKTGKSEGRRCSVKEDNFDWEYYVSIYEDLRHARINTKQAALAHWVIAGKLEGRKCNISAICAFYNKIVNDSYAGQTKYNLDRHNVHIYKDALHEKYKTPTIVTNEKLKITTEFNVPEFGSLPKIDDLSQYDSFVLVIDMPNWGGGTTIFMNKIISAYKDTQTFLIARNFENRLYFYVNDDYMLTTNFDEAESVLFLYQINHKISKIFINHTIQHSPLFIRELFLLNIHISTITHDYGLLFEVDQPYIHEMFDATELQRKYVDVNQYDCIITQNVNNLFIYDKYLDDGTNIIITPLPDYCKPLERVETNNTQFVIGIIGDLPERKGLYIVEQLNEFLNTTDKIKIVIFGRASRLLNNIQQYKYSDIVELNELLIEHKPNILLELSLWPETYSFTLSLAMLTQLPIFYQKKTFNSVIENRLFDYEKAHSFSHVDKFIQNIDNVIIEHKQNYFYTIEPNIYYNDFWDHFFDPDFSFIETTSKNVLKYRLRNGTSISNYSGLDSAYSILSKVTVNTPFYHSNRPANLSTSLSTSLSMNLSTYFVYFPQFHEIHENNIHFYDKYTDITNLDYLMDMSNNISNVCVDTPSLSEYNLSTILDYDLKKKPRIIQKQIDILKQYNMNGFAIYYYWFSTNTVTGKHAIMDDVINTFFDKAINMYDKKVFFIWANENWTDNKAFGNIDGKIENVYDITNFQKNIDNMMSYFKHPRYLKIDNKPVFFLHHPWFMTDSDIVLFKILLNQTCIENKFDGVYLLLNSIMKTYDNHLQYNFHFKYKDVPTNKWGKRCFDYETYTNAVDFSKTTVQTLVFDFDNSARLCKPNRLQYSTTCSNTTDYNIRKFIKNTIDSYKNKSGEINNILLVNSWNEWGERMAVEPSNERGYYYLDLIKEGLEQAEA